MNKKKQQSKGFLIVASMSKAYYDAAILLAISIHDFYPDAKIAFFTHPEFMRDQDRYLFDYINLDIPKDIRAKLWALDKTPYDITLYMDADTEVQHDDFVTVFDQLGKNDILFTRVRLYSGRVQYFTVGDSDKEFLPYHGGLFLYRKTKNMLQFMREWYINYKKQRTSPWPYPEYPEVLKPWDQFTIYRMLREEWKGKIKVGIFEDDARWNFVRNYRKDETDKPIIVWHYTIPKGARSENRVKRIT